MKTMLSEVLQLLEALETAIPPDSGHHSLTLGEYGSDEAGWCECLCLGVREGDGQRVLLLYPQDFEKSQDELVTEIVDIMSRPAE